ncbi:DUF6901 family protein [Methylomonas sp. MgM2]
MNSSRLNFLYKLLFPDTSLIEFAIVVDQYSCSLIPNQNVNPPDWARLEFHQCSNCPLTPATTPFCPVTVNLIPVLRLCNSIPSYQNVKLEVVTPERTISGDTTTQRALSSISGLIMATSSCPHTEYLKPMARFHLPLASEDETIYRATSMYLLAQYFRRKDGLAFNLDLDQLKIHYEQLQLVNKALAKRLQAAVGNDSTINAVVLLDLLSKAVAWSIEDDLEEIRYLFDSYGVRSMPKTNE